MTVEVAYRPAAESDVERTYEVMLEANEELNGRLHRAVVIQDTSPPARALAVRCNAIRHDPDRFWVAEADGEVVGFGLATVRRHLWYLAALHVIPAFQSMGIGRELITRCLTGEAPGSTRLTVTDAAQPVSNALYGRFGMFPQVPIVEIEGPPRACGQADSALDVNQIDAGDGAAADLAAIDESIFGTARPEDHECWLGMPKTRGFRLYHGSAMVGYLYLDDQGVIGPVAMSESALLVAAVETAIRLAADAEIALVRARVPGAARSALTHFLDHRFRIGPSTYLLLTSSDLRNLDRYLASGGDALF
jgi:GNAT superfamily N-acetyltransferase